jgi:hypothetical protein
MARWGSYVWLAWMCSQYCLYIVLFAALLYNRNNAPFDSSYFKLWINLGLSMQLLT